MPLNGKPKLRDVVTNQISVTYRGVLCVIGPAIDGSCVWRIGALGGPVGSIAHGAVRAFTGRSHQELFRAAMRAAKAAVDAYLDSQTTGEPV